MVNLNEIPKGQLSTIILLTLKERDKYGYEIIDEVLKTTNGKISIKQPSLYSSLKRMEEQSLISSYWRDSDIGGKRHYYHITDLGKKHLLKIDSNLLLENFKQQEPQDKFLQQQSLFGNQTFNSSINNEPQTQTEKDESFIQYDLFNNKSIINPPSNETNLEEGTTINTQSQVTNNVTTSLESNNNLLNEKEQNFSQSFNQAYKPIKKTNKSFSDTFKSSSNYTNKYINQPKEEKTVVPEKSLSENQLDLIKEINKDEPLPYNNFVLNGYVGASKEIINTNIEEKSVILPNSNSNNNLIINNEINNESQQNLTKYENQTNISKLENKNKDIEKEDDGVFITDRLDPADMPKPTKWEGRKFEVYMSGNNIFPDLKKSSKIKNYEDRIKDLYEKGKANPENQELELIDSKVNPSNYTELTEFYNEQNIKFKPYQKTLKKTEKNLDMIKENKLKFFSSLISFIYILCFSLAYTVFFFKRKSILLSNTLTFIVLPIIFASIFIYRTIEYIKNPNKKSTVNIKKYNFKTSYFLISLLIIPLILAINLLIGFNFKNFKYHFITLTYPLILSTIYLFNYIVTKILIKIKNLY